MIIAVDFDGVLSSAGKWPEVGEPNEALMNWLSDLRTGGHKVILWTCRVGEALESAVAQCREHGLEFDGVNSRKITADYYIDDKAVVVKFEKGKEHE
nr:MAG: 5' nucleotidase [Bacteriophage sp.]